LSSREKRIFETKGRARKPLPILAFSIKHVNRVARLNERARKLVERFWPGSLTLVLEKKESLPSIVTCGFDRVGVRVPAHEVALTLIKLSGGLLVGTSANKSGSKPPRTAKEAANQVGDKVDLILDGGPTPLGVSSTVVDVTSEKIRVIREGPVSVKDVNQVLGF
jgi:L-threonylcarbamoyladenylate synthase